MYDTCDGLGLLVADWSDDDTPVVGGRPGEYPICQGRCSTPVLADVSLPGKFSVLVELPAVECSEEFERLAMEPFVGVPVDGDECKELVC